MRVAGQTMSRTTRGFSIVATGGGSGISPLKQYRIKDVKDDYLVCRSWNSDDETDGDTDIFIAKEYKHRETLTSETILGVDHDYTYADGPSEDWAVGTDSTYNRTRSDDDGSSTESQRLVPPWVEDEIISAIPAKTGVTTEDDDVVSLLIVGRSTQWCKTSS